MAVEIKVPALGESVATATVLRWIKQPGELVAADEPVVELETDKVSVEVPAPQAGVLGTDLVAPGTEVSVGGLLGSIDPEGRAAASAAKPAASKVASKTSASPGVPAGPSASAKSSQSSASASGGSPSPMVFPAAGRLLQEHALDPRDVGTGSGLKGRITKGDVMAYLAEPKPSTIASSKREDHRAATAVSAGAAPSDGSAALAQEPREQRVPMTGLRQTIARRLKEAQNTAAILTTFNEVDMSAAMALRAEYKERFAEKHGVKLGYMSLFARASVRALQDYPALNAMIDGNEIVYRRYVNLGIAVGSERGLVVPVVHGADALDFAALERKISDYGKRAREGALALSELSNGTFSITNGGVFGSMLSTPILNPPQSAILGMHAIQERPVALKGQVVIRPMMYLALSYDHRIVDGREAVGFLVRVKHYVEDPCRLLLDV